MSLKPLALLEQWDPDVWDISLVPANGPFSFNMLLPWTPAFLLAYLWGSELPRLSLPLYLMGYLLFHILKWKTFSFCI